MKHYFIKEIPRPWPKLKVLETKHSFLDALVNTECPNCGKIGTGKQIEEHDCHYSQGE